MLACTVKVIRFLSPNAAHSVCSQFILLVEKDAAFMRLSEDRFYRRYPCILITAKGQPDVATRMFLRRLKMELKIPVLGLVDSDPYGLKILSVYMSGSKAMSYDSANLTTPDIKWLGAFAYTAPSRPCSAASAAPLRNARSFSRTQGCAHPT